METIMTYTAKAILAFLLPPVALFPLAAFAQPKHPITVEDCVSVRYLNPDDLTGAIRMNAQGTRVAYVIKAPNIAENRNDDQLYVKSISGAGGLRPRELASAEAIKNIQWLRDGKHFLALVTAGGESTISEFDAETGTQTAWVHSKDDLREYSVDANAEVVVFAAEVSNTNFASINVTQEQRARGYRIPSYVDSTSIIPRREIFISRRSSSGKWGAPTLLHIPLPFTHATVDQIPYLITLALSLSPDGKQLLFNYDEGSDLPEDWKENPTVRTLTQRGLPGIIVTALYDLSNGSVKIPLRAAQPTQVPVWSDDSSSYIAFSHSPVGSKWAEDDERAGDILNNASLHMFLVRPSSREVEMIPALIADTRDRALLFWNNATRTAGIRTEPTRIDLFVEDNKHWRPTSSIQVPIEHFPHNMQFASDGKTVVGDMQSTTKPPELFIFDVAKNAMTTFETLNPQFASLDIAPVREIHWKTSTGFPETGLLVLPTHYDPAQKYPLVIGTKFMRGEFACDSGPFHSPSFAPQPTANAGMMYLIGLTPEGPSSRGEEAFYPKGYPGGTSGVAEAAFYMDIWDSAVDFLSAQGLVDTSKLGIIGFSRTGWHTEFILAHSRHHYSAATVADNVQYSLSEYWLQNVRSVRQSYEVMYGGPPYGPSLENWKKYSISFNLDKLHTPLLMEENGYGVVLDRTSIPWSIAATAEVFAGLTELHKPVEMYFYPDEQHQSDHPKARVADLQRNIDWYRFWLQGFEKKDRPEDPDMYIRWRQLKHLQEKDTSSPPIKTVE
jgi:dipeptidyl aminopeptidase/acylaminoacyl peptidase